MSNFINSYQHVSRELLDGKIWLQSHIVEQLKCNPMIIETWESIQGNQHVPLFVQGTLSSACGSMHKTFTAELMDVSGLWDLNEKKVEELLYLSVFVWSPRSEV